jgi:hypothetical protein
VVNGIDTYVVEINMAYGRLEAINEGWELSLFKSKKILNVFLFIFGIEILVQRVDGNIFIVIVVMIEEEGVVFIIT